MGVACELQSCSVVGAGGGGVASGGGGAGSLRSLPGDPSAGTPALSASCSDSSSAAAPAHTQDTVVLEELDSEPRGRDPSPGWTSGCGVTVSSSVARSRGVSWAGSAGRCPPL